MKKFRAYDKQTNHMYYVPNSHIYMNIDGTCVNFQNGVELEVMFWTGEIARNKVSIYDGDIVKTPEGFFEVVFEIGCFMYRSKTRIVEILNMDYEETEVLGNIKQHKIEDFK